MTESRDSNVRDRTRRTILLAAIEVLARQPTATLADVAQSAGVARSTLHRYFTDRSALVASLEELVNAEYEDALDRSRPDEGTGLEAYTRLVGELLESLPVFAWWMQMPELTDDYDSEPEDRAYAVVRRGHADGTIDSRLDPEWVISLTWSALWSVTHASTNGNRSPRELREMCLRSLVKIAASSG